MFLTYILANSLENHRVSVKLQLDQLLFHVKERFSEVLLPVETITKLEIYGKGTYQIAKKLIVPLLYL